MKNKFVVYGMISGTLTAFFFILAILLTYVLGFVRKFSSEDYGSPRNLANRDLAGLVVGVGYGILVVGLILCLIFGAKGWMAYRRDRSLGGGWLGLLLLICPALALLSYVLLILLAA